MGSRFHPFAALAALALAGCGGEPAETTAQDAAPAAADAAGGATMPAMPSQEFVAAASSGGMYETEAAKIALAKSADKDVKAFAETMIADHTKAGEELKAAASAATPSFVPATAMTADQQAKVDALKAASAAEFDATYKSQMKTGHDEMLAMLRGYAANGESEPLKQWAAKTAPVVSVHQAKVRALEE